MKIAVLGASGRTGIPFVEQALAASNSVRALVRSQTSLRLTHARLETLIGTADSAQSIEALLNGCDAVVSVLGQRGRGDKDICSTATGLVLEQLGDRPYVVVSGAGVDFPGDEKGFGDKVISTLVRWVAPEVFADKVKEMQLLLNTKANFVAVRPPRLANGPATGHVKVSLNKPTGNKINRSDLAAFLLEALAGQAHSRQAPFVSG